MKFKTTEIKGLILVEPSVFEDERGHFMEFYNSRTFQANGIDVEFVQDNLSHSKKGVIRGLHFQEQPFEQGKLVRVAHGSALDVVLDLRKDSPTFGQTYSLILSAENNFMLWIPAGFAHGFEALSDDVVFIYKVTKYYNQSSEKGIRYNDPELNIKWQTKEPIVSKKDSVLPTLKEYLSRNEIKIK
ncbi:MAG: dTDP-4-dehydrorhamnose 3,5-epimerase [Bacteroidetes bacterium]|nr:MAG: dTDP-4-dehydrorhamnose 3,5-epimerase [Bacteroidota bacterium]